MYVPETRRATDTPIKLPSCIKLAFHYISWGRCTATQATRYFVQKPFIFFFRNFCHILDNVEKYCTAGKATDDNMAKNALTEYVKHIAFPLQQWLHVHCLSCCSFKNIYSRQVFLDKNIPPLNVPWVMFQVFEKECGALAVEKFPHCQNRYLSVHAPKIWTEKLLDYEVQVLSSASL